MMDYIATWTAKKWRSGELKRSRLCRVSAARLKSAALSCQPVTLPGLRVHPPSIAALICVIRANFTGFAVSRNE
ncbi:MAG TPA: hypothetical protein DHE23_16435 [Agrobacterium sp.]|nr:hypothetical protein [Agrobacterium sp.]